MAQPMMAPSSEWIETKAANSEDKEEAEKEAVARSLAVRGLFDQNSPSLRRNIHSPYLGKNLSLAKFVPTVVGHQLFNGLRAPLLI